MKNIPGEPQKSVKILVELKTVLKPKSHNLRSKHFPFSLSKVSNIFSGFKSVLNKKIRYDSKELY